MCCNNQSSVSVSQSKCSSSMQPVAHTQHTHAHVCTQLHNHVNYCPGVQGTVIVRLCIANAGPSTIE